MFRSPVFSIRVKVDEVYRKLHHLCDVLEGLPQVSHDPSIHKHRISESNEFLDGLKRLFDNSNTDEQIRLMTIAPNTWGRKKIEKWFVFIVVFLYFSLAQSFIDIDLLHLLGFEQNQIKQDDRWFYEKKKEC